MPFLRFHSADAEKLAEVGEELTDRLQEVIGCPREHIVLEVIHSDLVLDGCIGSGNWPFVEISYFERSREVQDKVAEIVSEYLKEAGYEDSDVYFQYLVAKNYYVNGKPME